MLSGAKHLNFATRFLVQNFPKTWFPTRLLCWFPTKKIIFCSA